MEDKEQAEGKVVKYTIKPVKMVPRPEPKVVIPESRVRKPMPKYGEAILETLATGRSFNAVLRAHGFTEKEIDSARHLRRRHTDILVRRGDIEITPDLASPIIIGKVVSKLQLRIASMDISGLDASGEKLLELRLKNLEKSMKIQMKSLEMLERVYGITNTPSYIGKGDEPVDDDEIDI